MTQVNILIAEDANILTVAKKLKKKGLGGVSLNPITYIITGLYKEDINDLMIDGVQKVEEDKENS